MLHWTWPAPPHTVPLAACSISSPCPGAILSPYTTSCLRLPGRWAGRDGSGSASVKSTVAGATEALAPSSTLTGNGLPAATTSGSPGNTMLWGIGSGFPTGWSEGLGHTTWKQGLKTQWGDLGQWETGQQKELEDQFLALPSRDRLLWGTVVPKTCLQDNVSHRAASCAFLRSYRQRSNRLLCLRFASPIPSLLLFWNCSFSQSPPT